MAQERIGIDLGMTQAMKPINTGHKYSTPSYSSGETIRGTGGHATEPIRPHSLDSNPTIAHKTRATHVIKIV